MKMISTQKKFIELINNIFGLNQPYHNKFKRTTLTVSYCYVPNINIIINAHKKIVVQKYRPDVRMQLQNETQFSR